MSDTKVFIACHKPCEVSSDPLYLPLHVGAYGKEDIGFVRDDSGDNISSKNPIFCELTGLYWCWKNLDYDHLGLVHYRRYFTLKNKRYQKQNGQIESVLTSEETESLLSNHRVIVPKKRHYYIENIYDHYSHTFTEDHLKLTKQILSDKYPDYLSSWDEVMRSTSAYVFNMFIMDREFVDDYCKWLFDILFELENRVDPSNMTPFEKRYAGRISEILFNVWLLQKIKDGSLTKKDIKEIPYLYIGEIDWKNKIISFLKAKFLHKKYEKSF